MQGPEHLLPLYDRLRSPLPPEAEANRDADCQDQLAQQPLLKVPAQLQGDRHANGHEGNQDGQLLLAPIPLHTSKEASRQEPEIERSIIPQSPPHEHGPEDLRPLHDGAGSPQPPEDGVSKHDGEGSPLPPQFEVGNQEGQLVLAPIPVEAK